MMIQTFHFFEWKIGSDLNIRKSVYIVIPSLCLYLELIYYVEESAGARGLSSSREICLAVEVSVYEPS